MTVVCDKLERMWRELVVVYYKVLSQHSSSGTGEEQNYQSGSLVCELRFELETSRMRIGSATN
jgi:hypothetical protein